MKSSPAETDFIVVGAGVAGLRAAIELAPAGRVLVLAKRELSESATNYAQGGIAVALSDEDEISLHLQDTINAGDGLVNEQAAHVLVEEGPERIQELIDWGTEFDRSGTKLTFAREGAHSRSRVLHAHGDSTGKEIGRALYAKAKTLKHISFQEFEFSADLHMKDGQVRGVTVLDESGETHPITASAVLLATGGLGNVYLNTTNPSVATGDGVAMAHRAGAEISDMEFVQFHPTALYLKGAPRFLLSEALRGEGAYLRNGELHRFMAKYHDMHELAPRDVVARAIMHELELTPGAEPVVYLDLTHLDPDKVHARFPRIFSTCMQYNVDIAADLIPIRPAAHYSMGGVRTDLDGRTSLPRLFAAGEAACTGVHGANRLASNSLLEGLVFGARAGAAMRASLVAHEKAAAKDSHHAKPAKKHDTAPAEKLIHAVQELMWKNVGIVRSNTLLQGALERLTKLAADVPARHSRRDAEAHNLHDVALLITRSALARRESRGAHYRTDYPEHDDAHFKKHSILQADKVRFE